MQGTLSYNNEVTITQKIVEAYAISCGVTGSAGVLAIVELGPPYDLEPGPYLPLSSPLWDPKGEDPDHPPYCCLCPL